PTSSNGCSDCCRPDTIMPEATMTETATKEAPTLQPERPIRRFDVFAEYRKQDEEAKGHPEDEAMGYGLWVAKVVASRRFGGATLKERHERKGHHGKDEDEQERRERLVDGKWHALDGEPQTDALFEHEIVERMGHTFYH